MADKIRSTLGAAFFWLLGAMLLTIFIVTVSGPTLKVEARTDNPFKAGSSCYPQVKNKLTRQVEAGRFQ